MKIDEKAWACGSIFFVRGQSKFMVYRKKLDLRLGSNVRTFTGLSIAVLFHILNHSITFHYLWDVYIFWEDKSLAFYYISNGQFKKLLYGVMSRSLEGSDFVISELNSAKVTLNYHFVTIFLSSKSCEMQRNVHDLSKACVI